MVVDLGQGIKTVLGQQHLKATLAQKHLRAAADRMAVVDHQHCGHGCSGV